MAGTPSPLPPRPHEAPPLGSWPRTYSTVAVLAVLVMALLWWLTAALNTPLGSAK